jgi:DNA-binding response OmpR family regulator
MVKQSIVVTDHDSSYLEMIEDVLRSEGYTDVTCVMQEDAYEAIQRAQPAVVLLDIHLGNEAEG